MHDEKEPSEETFKDRLRKMSLAAWGVITIFSALLVFTGSMAMLPPGRLSMNEKAQFYGVATATVVLILAGIVLIVLHFVKRKKR